MKIENLFKALGEPTRLKMVERLSSRGSHTITSLSKELSMSRQGARKHLQILEDAEVISLSLHGRNTIVQLDQRALDTAKRFISKLELQWEKRLEALRDFVDQKQRKTVKY